MNIDATSPDDFPLEELVESSTLDLSQAKALKKALTKEIALIQGPPGTGDFKPTFDHKGFAGKTYVGIQIVRALLSFKNPSIRPRYFPFARDIRSKLSPILCVCYTNHALDQFLLGLIHSGIENIVRVGGRSRSESLEPYNLRNLEKPNLGKRGYELKNAMKEVEKRIANADVTLKSRSQK